MPYIVPEYRKKPLYYAIKEFEIVDTTGDPITVTCYSDGELTFWSSNGNSINFSKEDAIFLRKALKILDATTTKNGNTSNSLITQNLSDLANNNAARVDRFLNDYAMMPPEQLEKELAEPLSTRTNGHAVEPVIESSADIKPLLRSVKREEEGWGATVQNRKQQYRYYYATRDQARIAKITDKIGEEGRVA